MASPQKENGYTAIANEIMEVLAKTRIPGVERQIVDFVLRKTYGFGKVWDYISNSQFMQGTDLKKQHVYRALKSVVAKKIVTKKGYGNKVKYCFNKHYRTWKLYPKKVTVTKKETKVTKKGESIPIITKVDIQKGQPKISGNGYSEDFKKVWSAYPNQKGKQKAFQYWKRIKPDADLIQTMLDAIKAQAAEKEYLKTDPEKFCPEWPNGSTWIYNARWEDEVTKPKKILTLEERIAAERKQ